MNHRLISKRLGALTLSSLSLLASCGPAPIAGQTGTTPTSNPASTNPPSAIVTPAPGVVLPPTVIVTPTPSTTGSTPVPGSTATPVPGSTPVPIVSVTPVPTQSVAAGQLNILSNVLATGLRDFNYSHLLQASGGVAPYRWQQVGGQIPNGLTLDVSTGQIVGRPTQVGTFNFDVQVIDAQLASVRRTFTLTVTENFNSSSLSVLTSSLSSAVRDQSYSATLEPSGGTGPFSWSLRSGSLPSGLSLNSNGEVRGTPTSTGEETFTVQVTDSRGQTATRTLSITTNSTNSNVSIVTPSLPGGVGGTAYHDCTCGNTSCVTGVNLQAAGGNNSFTWSVSSGSLPSGLNLSSTGKLEGTLSSVSSPTPSTFTVQARDSNGNAASRVYSVTVGNALIKSFTPTAGGQGLKVNLTGFGFDTTAGNNSVKFGTGVNPVTATAITAPDTAGCRTLTVAVPATATDAVSGLLTLNKSGTVATTSANSFTVQEVVINEVHTNNHSAETQFIEIKNNSASPVDIGNWVVYYTGTDGLRKKYQIPATASTSPLLVGGFVTIYVNAIGANTGNTFYTGTTNYTDIRFSDTQANEVFLCSNSSCVDSADLTTFRDYLQFGAVGAATEANASNAGIWTLNQLINVSTLTTNILGSNVRAGVGTGNGIHISNGEHTDFALNDQVVVDNSAVGGKATRLLRTVAAAPTGPGPSQVQLNTALLSATVSGTNTGNGAIGNGITVNDTSIFNANDTVTIVTGTTLRTIQALVAGPKIEFTVGTGPVGDNIAGGNTGDGVAAGTATELLISTANFFTGVSTVAFTVNGASVNRTVTTPTDTSHVRITAPFLTVTVSGANTGDGTAGNPITVNSTAGLAAANTVNTSGVVTGAGNRTIGAGNFTATTMELNAPILQTTVAAGNTGDGTAGNGLLVAATTNFAVGNTFKINGLNRTITGLTAGPKIEFTALPFTATIGAGNLGDGVIAPITVSSTTGYLAGNTVNVAGFTGRTVNTVPTATTVTLTAPLRTVTVSGANTGVGGTGTGVVMTTDPTAAGFAVGQTVIFTSGLTRTIAALPGGNAVELNAALPAAPTSGVMNFVPVSGAMTLGGGNVNLVPTAGSITWVPTGGQLTIVPTSGSVDLVPISGTIRQYKSIKYGGNNTAGSYTITTAPNAGS